MKSKLVTGLLVVSLFVNAYLLATRSSGNPEPGATSATVARAERRGELPALPRAALPPGGTASAQDDGETTAREREAALTAELLKSQAALAKHQSDRDRLRQSADRSPALEEQGKVALEQIFPTKAGQKPIYDIECYGERCMLQVDDSQDPEVWRNALQTSNANQLFRSILFTEEGALLDPAPPEEVTGARYLQALFGAIQSSPATAACKQQFPAPGEVTLRAALGPTRDVSVTMTGTLADKEFGACLRPILDRAPGLVPPLPANVQSLPNSPSIVSVARPDAPRSPDAPIERRPTRKRLASSSAPLR
jgi:hypothetical protein